MMLIDFSNAFNLVDRTTLIGEVWTHCPDIARWVEFCYSQPARLYYNDSILFSTQGVQQGDPLGPLLFALTLQPLVNMISIQCNLDFHAWYLDDGTIAGDTLEVAKALKLIQSEGPKRGLRVNIKKTEIFWPSPDPRCCQEGVFPADIGRSPRAVKLLGRPVSLDAQFCSDIVLSRVDKTVQLMEKVQQLQDPQSELLLLRNCTGDLRLYFSLRTTSPNALQEAISRYDNYLLQYMRRLTVGDGAGFGMAQQRMATLPLKDGGFGIYTMTDTSKYCFLASYTQTTYLQDAILQCPSPSDLSPRFDHALHISCKLVVYRPPTSALTISPPIP